MRKLRLRAVLALARWLRVPVQVHQYYFLSKPLK